MQRNKGLALAMVIQVLALLLVLVGGLTTVGVSHHNLVDRDRFNEQAYYAARAGAAAGLRELLLDSSWDAGFQDVAFGDHVDAEYDVEVTNNFSGTGTVTAANGVEVPAGCCYILATGSVRSGRNVRQSGILLTREAGYFPYAMAAGGSITYKAQADIAGPVKSSGDVTLSANVEFITVDGRGSLFSSGNIVNKNVTLESTESVKAAGTISDTSKINGTTDIVASDTSIDTEPFIADGRTTNTLNSGEVGEVLPNPDTTELLSGAVDYGTTTKIDYAFDLNGQTHYFPNGVTFTSKSSITGQGTIVVGGGNTASFETSLGSGSSPLTMNVIAIDGSNGTAGGSKIYFKSAAFIQGLLYSHEDIEAKAQLDVTGSVIAYHKNGEVIHSGASLDVSLAAPAFYVPGFDSWLGGSGGSSVTLQSWHRI